MNRICFFCLIFVFLTASVSAQNWERFRGPNGSGLSLESNLPTAWSEDDYQWKVKLAGSGSSSPVIWNEKIFVLSADAAGDIHIECLERSTGRQTWTQKFESGSYKIHRQNSHASSSAAVDNQHVYLTFAHPESIKLVALDHDGNLVWKRDLGNWQSQHGFGMSPMVHDDKIIFFNSQQADRVPVGAEPGSSHVIAVNKSDGSDAWSTELSPTRACYAMLCEFVGEDGKVQLIGTNTGNGFFSLNPADGKINWTESAFDKRTVASTMTAGGMVFGSNGSGGGGNYLVAVKPGEKGAEKAYQITRGANYVPTPVAVNDLLFFFGDRGSVSCVDLATGEAHWQQRVGRAGFSGSPVATKSHIYCIDPDGIAHVIKVSRDFELVSSNDLGEPSRSTPAISGNQILLRTDNHLISLQGEPNK